MSIGWMDINGFYVWLFLVFLYCKSRKAVLKLKGIDEAK